MIYFRLRIIAYIGLCVAAMTGCTAMDADSRLEDALAMAGSNRGELEKVLEYYEGDTQKQEAAKYLIRNMPGHYSYGDTTVIVRYSQKVDSIIMAMKDSSNASIREVIDSCAWRLGIGSLRKVQDVSIITAQYLIENIDDAFHSWQEEPWAQHLTFDEFCEYLLPYKVEELQLLDNWRKRLKSFHSEKLWNLDRCDEYKTSAFEASKTLISSYGAYLQPQVEENISYPIMKWETILKIPFGDCGYYSTIALALLRSNGIPVASDFTPHWAYQRLGHAWTTLMAENGHSYPFDDISSMPGNSFPPSSKLAKAYRRIYAMNEEMLKLNMTEKNVPPQFKNLFIKDVTHDYMTTVDVDIDASELLCDREYVFLAIYGDHDWTPISFGRVEGNRVHYRNLGRNVLYMPIVYNDGGMMEPIGCPFIVSAEGKTTNIEMDKKNKMRMAIKRKYPTLSYVYFVLNRLDSCEFQASNDADFKKYETIHRIGECRGAGYVTVADTSQAYRYWRFFSTRPEALANVAELYFFDVSGKRIEGKAIGSEVSQVDNKTHACETVVDGDLLTYFDAPFGKGTWVGLDFGKPVNISHFFYYPRGDGNAIQPDDIYELLYWDNRGWNSLGKKRATSPTLVYDNVPSGGIYLLRDLTRGHEERIFTYEKGKQIWW